MSLSSDDFVAHFNVSSSNCCSSPTKISSPDIIDSIVLWTCNFVQQIQTLKKSFIYNILHLHLPYKPTIISPAINANIIKSPVYDILHSQHPLFTSYMQTLVNLSCNKCQYYKNHSFTTFSMHILYANIGNITNANIINKKIQDPPSTSIQVL